MNYGLAITKYILQSFIIGQGGQTLGKGVSLGSSGKLMLRIIYEGLRLIRGMSVMGEGERKEQQAGRAFCL